MKQLRRQLRQIEENRYDMIAVKSPLDDVWCSKMLLGDYVPWFWHSIDIEAHRIRWAVFVPR